MSTSLSLLQNQIEKNRGVIRMMPLWIPRTFLPPGRRLKLHPDDLYPYGTDKGGICERWFCSTGVPGANGVDESTMSSFYLGTSDQSISFSEAIELIGNDLLGKETMDSIGTFQMFSKLYDYGTSLPLHIHPQEEYAKRVGMNQKPEAYYFPVELNSITYNHDYTYFGLVKGTTKEQFLECIRNFNSRDNHILSLSKAYKIKLGTGWYLPAGLLHAPASLVTYEPQFMSDSLVFYQNIIESKYVMSDRINDAIIPSGFEGDRAQYLLDIIDWEGNFEDFGEKYFRAPAPVKDKEAMLADGYYEEWISYGIEEFSAKRLRVLPGRTVRIKDASAYGFIMMQGYGKINGIELNTPSIIRFGQQTADEGFVIKAAAQEGVVIENASQYDEIVMLKHFNGDNKEWKSVI